MEGLSHQLHREYERLWVIADLLQVQKRLTVGVAVAGEPEPAAPACVPLTWCLNPSESAKLAEAGIYALEDAARRHENAAINLGDDDRERAVVLRRAAVCRSEASRLRVALELPCAVSMAKP